MELPSTAKVTHRFALVSPPPLSAADESQLRAKDELIRKLRTEAEEALRTRDKARQLFDDMMGKVKLNVAHQLALEQKAKVGAAGGAATDRARTLLERRVASERATRRADRSSKRRVASCRPIARASRLVDRSRERASTSCRSLECGGARGAADC